MSEPWQLQAGELVAAYAAGRLSPVDAMASVLARLDAVNPLLNAVIARDDAATLAAAQASAERWRRGTPLSPLDGVPVSVKDNIPQRGLPCRWGSQLFAEHLPARDESPVARLRAAGALLFGKTNVPEFTLQGYTDNALFGPTRNPWDLALTPGGSSGGAVAAVAAGIGPLALATDGGGSIRRPCGYTGLVGLKPGWGVVPRADGLPEMLPGLEVIGPIARSLDDLARMLQVIAPEMPLPAFAAQNHATRPLRIAQWHRIGASPVDAGIAACMAAAADRLRTLGHAVEVLEAPAEVEAFNRRAWPVLSATGLAAVLDHAALQGREADLTPAMASLLAAGRALRATDLFAAQAVQRALCDAMDRLFAGVDLALTPASAAMPWAATQSHPETINSQAVDARGHAVFTAFANGAGLPALALPAGRVAGLPVGLQFVGPQGSDAQLCALGHSFLQQHDQPWTWPALPTPSTQEESLIA
jgi:aspartyl-tRNA(Asn)/glutamyl-tRNA(Gln) amidotransferase subunit A